LRLIVANYDQTIMAAKKKSKTKISKNFTTVSNKLLELIERGTLPWHQCWHNIGYQNLINKKPYSGINPILCQIDCLYYGYSSPYYLGKAQCSDQGWSIKQGSKANWLRWGGSKTITEQITDEQGQLQEREKFIRSFKWLMVFNTEAVDDSQSETKIADWLPPLAQKSCCVEDSKIEKFIANLNANIKYGGNQASHNFSTGQIRMPYRGQFTSRDGFWATLFHELVHSTAKELKRSYSGDKDDPIYHREELVADLAASFLGNHFGLGSTELEHHATYLEHYWSLLNSDTKTFFNAVYEAQKAAHYLLEVGGA
jgi:antirestriction protein ArdC